MNLIGLPEKQSSTIANELNILLADYSVLYMNVRGFHWNIKGADFFELHLKFEEIYTDLVVKIDEIAERILTLGGVPIHSMTQQVATAEISEVTDVTDGKEALSSVLKAFQKILVRQRNLLEMASEINDEGTLSQMSDYITAQEKDMWMYQSYLS